MSRTRRLPEEQRAKARARGKKDREFKNLRRRDAQRFPLENQKCQICEREAEVRHHKSRAEGDIVFLCRNCHKLEHRRWN